MGKKRKVGVYIHAGVDKCIGAVEAETKEEYLEKADKLWEEQQYDYPTLCHQCSHEMNTGDWEIDEEVFDLNVE